MMEALEARHVVSMEASDRTVPAVPALPLARLRFTARMDSALDLGPFPGAVLRSVFGMALRQGVCVTGQLRCEGCPLRASCSYPALFDTPPRDTAFAQQFSQVPNPYVIEPPPPGPLRPGEPLVFSMVLIGRDAWRRLPELLQAWRRALAQGLGVEGRRSRGELMAVEVLTASGELLALSETKRLDADAVGPSWDGLKAGADEPGRRSLSLHFHTPLRLQHQGKALRPEALSSRTLLSHLLRRISLMLELHLDLPAPPFDAHELVALAAGLQDDRSDLRWVSQPRYSARQGQAMDLAGAVGTWNLHGPLGPLLPWLRLGQWLHVGKNATMGHGAYALSLGPAPSPPGVPCP